MGMGAAPVTIREKVVGPALPAVLVAVIERGLVAAKLGVPVSRPADEKEAQVGKPVPLQVMGVVPVAVNWKLYGLPISPAGNGLLELIVGGTVAGGAMASVKESGPSLPVALVAVTVNELVPDALGVPVNKPPELSEAHPGKPELLQAIGVVPVAAN